MKQRFSAREAAELFAYCERNPIDDQSNHHLPIANLQSTVHNLMGGTAKLTDFLIFRNRENDDMDIEDILMKGNW